MQIFEDSVLTDYVVIRRTIRAVNRMLDTGWHIPDSKARSGEAGGTFRGAGEVAHIQFYSV